MFWHSEKTVSLGMRINIAVLKQIIVERMIEMELK